MSASLTGKLARIIELNPERVEPILCDVARHRWGNVQGTLWERERERDEHMPSTVPAFERGPRLCNAPSNYTQRHVCPDARSHGMIRAGERAFSVDRSGTQ